MTHLVGLARPSARSATSAIAKEQIARAKGVWVPRVIGGIVLLLTAACAPQRDASAPPGGGRSGGARSGAGGGPVAVTTAPVAEKSMAVTLLAVGTVEAYSTVEVHSQITGQLLGPIDFKEGEDVVAGQLLFTIDPRPFQVTLDQAIATLAKDTAQAKNARGVANRSQDLFQQGLVPRADLDTALANATSLEATLLGDSAQVDGAKLQLQYTKILAPVAGRTGALNVHPGALIRANDTAAMVVINQIAPIYVSLAVPSRQLADVRAHGGGLGLPVIAVVAGSATAPSTGTVSFIDNLIDQTTDTIRLKATFPNTDRRLWPGQFVEATVQLSVDPHAIVVPSTAVQPSQQGTFAYVVKADNTVEARPVTVARTDGDLSVITTGLHAGEIVVTDGQLRLTPGARVSTGRR